MKETLFRLTYVTDAKILVEVGELSEGRAHSDETLNDKSLALELDMID